jgi:hypothetical protein
MAENHVPRGFCFFYHGFIVVFFCIGVVHRGFYKILMQVSKSRRYHTGGAMVHSLSPRTPPESPVAITSTASPWLHPPPASLWKARAVVLTTKRRGELTNRFLCHLTESE